MHNRDKLELRDPAQLPELPPVLSNVGAAGACLLGKHEGLQGSVTSVEWSSPPPVAHGSGILVISKEKGFSEIRTGE